MKGSNMKILLIRHGDPDYEIDGLTETGKIEAQLLSDKLVNEKIDYFYTSPLGRAKDTAAYTLNRLNQTAIEYEWLREFDPRIDRPDKEDPQIVWDWLPKDWTSIPDFYSYEDWTKHPVMQKGKVKEEYDWIVNGFDQLLEKHGYKRSGNYYEAVHANNDTIAIFCHFGLACVLISHLLHISPMILWHGLCAAPTSVTTITTEERRKGIASFRMNSYGDVSHLYAGGQSPAFAARFCECFDNENERHD